MSFHCASCKLHENFKVCRKITRKIKSELIGYLWPNFDATSLCRKFNDENSQ